MSTPNDTSASPPPVLIPDARTIIGPIFVGNLINWMLMGTLVVQVYVYYVNSVGDRLMIRALVYGVFILDVVQTIFGTHFAWYYAIANWDNFPALLENTTWSEPMLPIMCGLVAGIVQLFYAWRIWVLNKTIIMRIMSILIVLIALSQGTSAIVAASIFEFNRTQQNLLRLHPAFSYWLAGSFVADILISGCMIWILSNAKTRTSWSNSETLINRLITNTIQTGTATVVCAGIDLALFVKLTNANYHLTPAYILGKLYSNSLLVTLNSRKSALSMNTTPSESDSYAMRSRGGGGGGAHHHQRAHRPERSLDDWPGVKPPRVSSSEGTIMQVSNGSQVNTDIHDKRIQIDLTDGKSSTDSV